MFRKLANVSPDKSTESPILFRSCGHETPFSDQKGASKIGDSVLCTRLSWLLAPGPWTLDPGPWTLAPGPWTLDPGPWTLDPGPWTLDPGPWTLDPGPWTSDWRVLGTITPGRLLQNVLITLPKPFGHLGKFVKCFNHNSRWSLLLVVTCN